VKEVPLPSSFFPPPLPFPPPQLIISAFNSSTVLFLSPLELTLESLNVHFLFSIWLGKHHNQGGFFPPPLPPPRKRREKNHFPPSFFFFFFPLNQAAGMGRSAHPTFPFPFFFSFFWGGKILITTFLSPFFFLFPNGRRCGMKGLVQSRPLLPPPPFTLFIGKGDFFKFSPPPPKPVRLKDRRFAFFFPH